MKTAHRYLIAKYVPDLRRMEPVNIGVVLWVKGRIASKFLPHNEAATYVNDKDVYKRWMNHWMTKLSSTHIKTRSGRMIERTKPEYVDEFVKTQKGNYLLTDGGEIIDKVNMNTIEKAVEFLYDELVNKGRVKSSQKMSDESSLRLKPLCERIFKRAGISDHDDYHESYPVVCRVGSVEKEVKAHYALANGQLNSVFHRVQLNSSQSVCSASFMFEHLTNGSDIPKDKLASIVYANDEQANDPELRSSLAMLAELSTVVNLRKKDEAIELLEGIAIH